MGKKSRRSKSNKKNKHLDSDFSLSEDEDYKDEEIPEVEVKAGKEKINKKVVLFIIIIVFVIFLFIVLLGILYIFVIKGKKKSKDEKPKKLSKKNKKSKSNKTDKLDNLINNTKNIINSQTSSQNNTQTENLNNEQAGNLNNLSNEVQAATLDLELLSSANIELGQVYYNDDTETGISEATSNDEIIEAEKVEVIE